MTSENEVTLSEAARLLGYKGSYITKLKQDGRLVLTDDGKRVKLAESRARIDSTRDPARQDVTDRHAEARATAQAAPAVAPPPSPAAESAPTEAGKIGNTFQAARAVKERYLAMSAKRDYEVSMRALLPAAEVENALADAVTHFRTRTESLPSILGPQLAAITDEAQATATIADAMEHILEELSRQFAAITKATHE